MPQALERATNNEGQSWLHSLDLLTDQSEGTGPMADVELITAEQLREDLSYDPETGIFTRRRGPHPTRVGKPVGSPRPDSGYVEIRMKGRKYYAHRLAWLWMTGEWPSNEIDHRDLNPSNNQWGNLRGADHSDQMRNIGVHKDSQTGLKGASFHAASGLFRARIWVDGTELLLGYFKTAEEAHAVYAVAAKKYFGEFARTE